MMPDVCGLPLQEALSLLETRGIFPEVVYTKPPFASFDPAGRTKRVIALQGERLIVAGFKDGKPEDTTGE